ncbi:hypothetical protein DYQ86_23145 [Acidobacteria bacterium AB60]|nr:hypothetical protein DYQ86_23145 [Acidobacteria bacterium AB60]
MLTRRILHSWILAVAAFPLGVYPQAPAHPAPQVKPAAPQAPPEAQVANPHDIAGVQRQLIDLLRLSPTLTTVVSHDPSLLADQEYVSRNNPQLAAFLAAHPEVARNPDFYLFTHMNPQDGTPDEALQHEVWPDVYHAQRRTGFDELVSDMPPVFALVAFLIAATWGIRVFVENRRWSRTFKLQSDVHTRLIDKFSTNQELAAYMQTEAGRRFLEASPIPLHDEASRRVPNAVARVLTPVQIGTVLILLGIGFLLLRNVGPDYDAPMRVLGVLILMPGIGFLLSAGLTWFLATRMGLMPGHAFQRQSDQRL